MTFLEFILFLVLVAPFLIIAGHMLHPSNSILREKMKMDADRRRAMKGDYSKRDEED